MSTSLTVSKGSTMLGIDCLLTTNGLCVTACHVRPSKIIGTGCAFASARVRTTGARTSRTALVTAFAPKGRTVHGRDSGLMIPHVNIHFHLPTRVRRIACFNHKPRRGCYSQGGNALMNRCRTATRRVCFPCMHPRRGKRRASAH